MTDRVHAAGFERHREGHAPITGRSHFVDDLRSPTGRPPALHMLVVRSPYAHAAITGINLDVAREVPGVVAAFDGAELVQDMRALDSMPLPGLNKPERLNQ